VRHRQILLPVFITSVYINSFNLPFLQTGEKRSRCFNCFKSCTEGESKWQALDRRMDFKQKEYRPAHRTNFWEMFSTEFCRHSSTNILAK